MNDEKQRLRAARSYDGAANTYERVNAPLLFDAPARCLVAAVAPRAGARILDVGCGTGAVSRAARAAAGPSALIVATDPSLDMLGAARRGGIELVVRSALPNLPFVPGSFDAVFCAFVLTHVDDPDAAIAEMARVLRDGGRMGASAWAVGDDQFSAAWSAVVAKYVDAERMSGACNVLLPADARFSQPTGLTDAFAAHGFSDIRSHDVELTFELTVEEYIEGREVCASGRTLQSLLTEKDWERFRHDARAALGSRFPSGVTYTRRVYIATAGLPAH
ncbi:MAG TPA: methyltransferase domain-containing protein [Candidatus Krumholzibacteria bacterium]|nr:methyltransferase domain-containing protein [Candidatus Krumholzibacteria bacterium]